MGKKIRGRVNKSLGDNALRDYLANHEETAKEKPPVYPKHLVEYCDPIEDPEVLLINPPITKNGVFRPWGLVMWPHLSENPVYKRSPCMIVVLKDGI